MNARRSNAISTGDARRTRRHTMWRLLGMASMMLIFLQCSSDNALRIDFSSTPESELIEIGARLETAVQRSGTVRGELPAQEQFGELCTGIVEREPAYTLRLDAPTPLRLIVRADASEDLVVVLTGRYTTRCNDDFDARNPGMQVYLEAGDYDIYVGTAEEQESSIPYELDVMPADRDRPFQGLSRAQLGIALQRRDTWASSANVQDIKGLQERVRVQTKAFELPVPVEPPALRSAPRFETVRVEKNLSGEIVNERFDVRANAALWPLERQCGGYVDTYGADVVLQIPRAFEGGISCAVDADNAVEIALRSPDESWRCGGRTGDGRALLEWAPWMPGKYRVFVAASLPRAVVNAAVLCQTVSE